MDEENRWEDANYNKLDGGFGTWKDDSDEEWIGREEGHFNPINNPDYSQVIVYILLNVPT